MLTSFSIDHFLIAFFAALLVIAAVNDATRFRIPNWISVALAALYPLHVFLSPVAIDWLPALGIALAVFIGGLGLFAIGKMGGGDVKLLSVTALWAGLPNLAPLFLVTALVGGAMALVMLSPARYMLAHAYDVLGGRVHLRAANPFNEVMLPYGVAIAAGGLVVAFALATGGRG